MAASVSWNGMNLSHFLSISLSCCLGKRWGWNGWSSGSMRNSCCAALWIPRSVFLQLSDPRPLFQSLYIRYTTFSLTAFLSLNCKVLFICCLLPLSVCVFQNPLCSAFSKSGFMCAAKTDSTFTLRSHLDRSVLSFEKAGRTVTYACAQQSLTLCCKYIDGCHVNIFGAVIEKVSKYWLASINHFKVITYTDCNQIRKPSSHYRWESPLSWGGVEQCSSKL